jgi:periplasmic divalent cation tolerance protein
MPEMQETDEGKGSKETVTMVSRADGGLEMVRFIEVITTTDKKEDAKRITDSLVEGRLAACVQILGPIESTYRWKGRIEIAVEWMCIAKTRADMFKEVEKKILGMHPYEVPQIVGIPIAKGSKGYMDWLETELKGRKRKPSQRK